ncbi:hypothetical protein [Jiangella endophytica]|uniref:hypothetical protein n=1 Tax=Jiangella endophytica TaxID=1623398 RepID=UPI000E34A3F5|nr:hypothetical protein [Jiangella endophytica]
MSHNELQQLETLLFQALPDPRGFADRVLEQLLDRLATEPAGSQPVTVVQPGPAPADGMDELPAVLAAALGACVCWGQDPGCPVCAGRGGSGWSDPDRELYAEYVAPAVRRRAAHASVVPDGRAAQEGVRS